MVCFTSKSKTLSFDKGGDRMSHHRILRGGGVIASAALLSLACGGGGTGGTGSDTSKGEIIIASSLPTSGADASSGLPTQQGANFAVSQKASVKGFKLTFLG